MVGRYATVGLPAMPVRSGTAEDERPVGGAEMDECNWTSCRALARLDLIAGATTSASWVVGSFCVPHACMASLDVQEEAGEPTWYDWHRERAGARAAADSAYEASAVVLPLFHHRRGGSSRRRMRRVRTR
jgi:hypothetical protein